MAGVTDYEKQLLKKFELFVRENIFDPRLHIENIGLFIDKDGVMFLCLEVVWNKFVSDEMKKEIELDIRLRIMGEFLELRGVEFFKAAEPVTVKIEKVEKSLIRPKSANGGLV